MNVLCKTETQTAKCKASKCTVSSSTKSIPTNPNSEPKYEPKPGSDRVPGPHKCMQVPYVLVLVPMQVPMNACMISGASATHEEIRAQCSPANIRQVLPPCQNRRAIRHRACLCPAARGTEAAGIHAAWHRVPCRLHSDSWALCRRYQGCRWHVDTFQRFNCF